MNQLPLVKRTDRLEVSEKAGSSESEITIFYKHSVALAATAEFEKLSDLARGATTAVPGGVQGPKNCGPAESPLQAKHLQLCPRCTHVSSIHLTHVCNHWAACSSSSLWTNAHLHFGKDTLQVTSPLTGPAPTQMIILIEGCV